jgi:transposase
MKPYSIDLRERVFKAYDRKTVTQKEVAKLFGVSAAFVRDLVRLHRETESIAPRPHGGGRKAIFRGEKAETLKGFVKEQPDATLAELLSRSKAKGSVMAVWRALEKMGGRLKKSHSARRSKTVRM